MFHFFNIHFNNGMCSQLYARTLDEVGPEAVKRCTEYGYGALIRGYDDSDKSTQVGAVGADAKGVYHYEAFTHD